MSPRERGSVGGPVPVSLRSCFLCYDHASSAHQFVGPRHLQLAERRRGLQVVTFKHLPGGVMHPPLGWLSCRRGGIGPTYGTRFLAARTLTSATVPVQRPDLKLRVSTRIKGGEMNRGIIGVIIGVLVIIILVIVILQLT